ncbi:MAG: hypothetical protein FJ100_17670 [Deltaproteobacteria bacterium]|nr:hypothetical protein [Deltaproteobacteria bacterium]
MKRRGVGGVVALAAAVAGACSEPTDCGREPGRCLPAAHAVRPTGPAVPGLPPAVAQPTLVAGRPLKVRVGDREIAVPQGRPAMPPGDTMAARRRPTAPQPEAPAAGADDPRAKVLRELLATALPAIGARDFKQLAGVCSKRFAAQLKDIEANHAERFWRHLGRFPSVLGSSDVRFRIEPGEGDGRTQGLVTAGGAELKPILVQEDGQWKIDRF